MSLSRRRVLQMGVAAGVLPSLRRGASRGLDSSEPPQAVIVARPLPLNRVRLTGGPLKVAQDADAGYLLSLEPDRMLAYYRRRAGLAPRAEPYAGWDGGGRNLTGHIAGHYLSAVSLMWAATGREEFKRRADYLVDELKAVQDRHGDGYLSALEGGRRAFGELTRGEIRSASFDLNGEWSPWYTLHKTYAGLRDAWRYAGNRTALEVESRFAEWAERILSGLDAEQTQRMLNTEFGGMNEVLADLYHDTGELRWLRLSYKFEHTAFIQPLRRHQDDLAGTHGNTQVPKLIGSAARYAHTGVPADLIAAAFFWDRVARHHSFATGGHGTDEYFGPPDLLGGRTHGRTAESCNVYNMLKLTRSLFRFHPDAAYADFHERALFNHALASMDPDDARMCYMVPVGGGVQHEYQNMQRSFTCCVGTGMENHALHGDGIYFTGGDKLWVNLYAPSTAEWTDAGARLAMETGFPEGETARLSLALDAPRAFTLLLRRPPWAGEGFSIRVNGETVPGGGPPPLPERGPYARGIPAGTYVELSRTWRTGDTVELSLPKPLRLEPTPDEPHRTAILWGPIVLAGDLGAERTRGGDEEERLDPPHRVPVLVTDQPVGSWLAKSGEPVRFLATGIGREPTPEAAPRDLELVPFYRLHGRTYAVYWDLHTPEGWQARHSEIVAEARRLRLLEAATVGMVVPGDEDSERAAGYEAGPNTSAARIIGRPARRTRSWISFRLPVDAAHPMALVATWYNGDRRSLPASFEILVEGQPIAAPDMTLGDPHRFFDVTYPVPVELLSGKREVTVRLQAGENSQVAALFGLRMVRADQLP